MQKIMFNDRYALTYAVIDEIKNNTRRIEGGKQFQLAATAAEDFTYEEATGWIVMCCQGAEFFRPEPFQLVPGYGDQSRIHLFR